jgi:hypothetical protein
MPHFDNDILVVTHEELIPKFWNNLKSLQSDVQREKIKQTQKGGRGRKMLIIYDSLPSKVRSEIPDPRLWSNPLEKYYKTDMKAVRYYADFRRNEKSMSPEEQQKYVINASVLQAAMSLESERTMLWKKTKGVRQSIIKDVLHFNKVLFEKFGKTQHNLPETRTNFKNILNQFKTDGYISLIKDTHGIGKQGRRKVTLETNAVLNGIFANLRHKPDATEIHKIYEDFISGHVEIYNEDTGETFNPKEFKTLSRSTINEYLSAWENKIATHKKRSGDRQKYMGKFKPHHQMKKPKYSGSLLSIDDRQPPFIYDEQRNRAWFYNGVDVASGCIIAWVYGKSKEGIILEFYRQLIRNCVEWGINLPYELECESALNSSFKDTFLREGYMFENVRIEANNARGKFIEPVNGILRYKFEKELEGWMPRPTAQKESNQISAKKVPVIPYETIIENSLKKIEEYNNMPSEQNPELSRWDYFMQNQNPNLKPINWQAFMQHIGYRSETSCNAGYIRLQGQKRAIAENGKILTGAALIAKLKQIEGREIEVFWLDDNEGKVMKALAYFAGRYICEIKEMPKYNRAKAEQTPQDLEIRELQSSYAMSVEGFGNMITKELLPLNIINRKEKTLNRNFQIRGLKRYESKTEETEIFDDEKQSEYEYIYNQNYNEQSSAVSGWRQNF